MESFLGSRAPPAGAGAGGAGGQRRAVYRQRLGLWEALNAVIDLLVETDYALLDFEGHSVIISSNFHSLIAITS